jgi:hypothetical protein
MPPVIIAVVWMLWVLVPIPGQAAPADNGSILKYSHPELSELSGLATSFNNPEIIWGHNDSGDGARLFKLNTDGQVVGQLEISNANAFDWEDMASFQDAAGNNFLVVADTGDNSSIRPFVDVYLLPEPASDVKRIKANRRFTLVFPDGPRDVESIAVDGQERFIYLLSKRDPHPRLYRFSIDALKHLFIPLNYLGEIKSLPSQAKHAALSPKYRWQFGPTAMAFSPAMDAAIIVTPRNTYYFARNKNENWLDALNRDPKIIKPDRLPQIESGTFSADSKQIFIGSEGKPAQVPVLPRPE